jgi:hypothetical protein
MDEARAVLRRLRRIDALERKRAPVGSMLTEVRALLSEAEAWVGAEGVGTDGAEEALERCRRSLAAGAADGRGR